MDATASTPTVDALEVKRIKFYKAFLIATMLNNVFLAWLCLAKGGGPALAAAPEWVPQALGALGAATVVFAGIALALRKIGAIGVVAAGAGAIGVSLVGGAVAFAVVFFLGTGLWALIAKRNWYRLV
jgi:hypothetical protein